MVISKDLLSSFCHKWQQGQQWEKSEAVYILFSFFSPTQGGMQSAQCSQKRQESILLPCDGKRKKHLPDLETCCG